MAGPLPPALVPLLDLALLSHNLSFFLVLIRVILSWDAPGNYPPPTVLIGTLTAPLLRPFRRLIPSIGGLDVSPILAIVLLQAVVIFLRTLKPISV
jgi:YggT family protein